MVPSRWLASAIQGGQASSEIIISFRVGERTICHAFTIHTTYVDLSWEAGWALPALLVWSQTSDCPIDPRTSDSVSAPTQWRWCRWTCWPLGNVDKQYMLDFCGLQQNPIHNTTRLTQI
jgi:hypothetical protein